MIKKYNRILVGERSTTTIGDEKHALIMGEVKPILLELINLCIKAIPEISDEYLCLEKIGQCVKIIDLIEDEFKKLKSLIENMRDEKRDMSFDRSRLESAKLTVRNVWNSFEEVTILYVYIAFINLYKCL